MKNIFIKIWLLLTILTIVSFVSRNDSYTYNKYTNLSDSSLFYWKLDSNGCANIRTFIICKSIVAKYNLLEYTKDSVKKYLGPGNIVEDSGDFIYFIHTDCNKNGVIIDSLDKCWVRVRFLDNKKVKDFLYECN